MCCSSCCCSCFFCVFYVSFIILYVFLKHIPCQSIGVWLLVLVCICVRCVLFGFYFNVFSLKLLVTLFNSSVFKYVPNREQPKKERICFFTPSDDETYAPLATQQNFCFCFSVFVQNYVCF